MYTGVYKTKMDAKRRVTLPQGVFGNSDEDTKFVLIWFGDHHRLYIEEVWGEVLGKIPMKLKKLLCKRMLTLEMDKNRRIFFPLWMFIVADDGPKFVLVGCGNHYKIYTREAWEEAKDEFVGEKQKPNKEEAEKVGIAEFLSPLGDFKFSHDADTQGVRINEYLDTSLRVRIPEKIEDMPVTSIGERAFFYEPEIMEVIIPDSVTTIGKCAFEGCAGLTSILIPGSVTTIGDFAFEGCWNLTSVAIPGSVTAIGEYAFADCWSLTSVEIPDSVTTIGEYAFEGCWSLTSVAIPDSVTTIGDGAFVGCTRLSEETKQRILSINPSVM